MTTATATSDSGAGETVENPDGTFTEYNYFEPAEEIMCSGKCSGRSWAADVEQFWRSIDNGFFAIAVFI